MNSLSSPPKTLKGLIASMMPAGLHGQLYCERFFYHEPQRLHPIAQNDLNKRLGLIAQVAALNWQDKEKRQQTAKKNLNKLVKRQR